MSRRPFEHARGQVITTRSRSVPAPPTGLASVWVLAALGQTGRFATQAIAVLLVGALTDASLFGQFMVYFAVTVIYVALIDVGLPLLAQVAIPSSYGYSRFLLTGGVIKAALALCVLPVPVLAISASVPDVNVVALSLFIGGALMQSIGYYITSCLRAAGRYGPDAAGNLVSAASFFVGLLVFAQDLSLFDLSLIYCTSRMLQLGLALVADHRMESHRETRIRRNEVWPLARMAFRYALIVSIPALMVNIDSLLIASLIDVGTNGMYQAVYRLALASVVVTEILVVVLLPRLAGLYAQDKARFSQQAVSALYLATGIAILVAYAFWLLGPFVVEVMFPYSMAFLSEHLHLFSLVVLMRVIGMWPGMILLVLGRERERVVVSAFALVVQVAGVLVLVPRLGIGGAVWTCVITHFVLYLGYFTITANAFRTLQHR